jgi:hypothetical protein
MSNKTKPPVIKETPKKTRLNPQQRAQRMQQILFSAIAFIVILSMILAITAK